MAHLCGGISAILLKNSSEQLLNEMQRASEPLTHRRSSIVARSERFTFPHAVPRAATSEFFNRIRPILPLIPLCADD